MSLRSKMFRKIKGRGALASVADTINEATSSLATSVNSGRGSDVIQSALAGFQAWSVDPPVVWVLARLSGALAAFGTQAATVLCHQAGSGSNFYEDSTESTITVRDYFGLTGSTNDRVVAFYDYQADTFIVVSVRALASTSPLTTKGDLWGYSTADARVPVGANGQVLMADSSQALGVKWAVSGSGIEFKESDGSPDQTGVTVATVNQATGLEISANSTGAVTLGLRAASATQQGAVTTGAQTFDGAKTFLSNVIASSPILANAGILCSGNLELYPTGVGTKYGTLGSISSYTYLYHIISGVGTMYLLVDQPNNRLVATTLSGSGNTKFAVESAGTVVNGAGGTNDIGDQFIGGLFTGTTAGGLPSVTPRWVTAPATATSSGTAGQIAKDGSFFYVCTATNTWRRVAIASW